MPVSNIPHYVYHVIKGDCDDKNACFLALISPRLRLSETYSGWIEDLQEVVL